MKTRLIPWPIIFGLDF